MLLADVKVGEELLVLSAFLLQLLDTFMPLHVGGFLLLLEAGDDPVGFCDLHL